MMPRCCVGSAMVSTSKRAAHGDWEPAYVLHRRAYRETSLLLECLTPQWGRVGVVARGARGARSPWRGRLEPFQALHLRVTGRGELRTLVAAESVERPRSPPARALAAAFYLSELTLRLLPRDDPAPQVFVAYGVAMQALCDGSAAGLLLRIYEKRLLQALGLGLSLDATSAGQPVVDDGWYAWLPEQGLVEVADAATQACPGWAVRALDEESTTWPSDPSRPLLRITQAAIEPLLGGKPLASRALQRRQPS